MTLRIHGELAMRRNRTRRLLIALGLCGVSLSSCSSTWLIPTRDAAVEGLSDFVALTVFNVLDQWINLGDPAF